jgi:hypothetical protein
MGTQNIRREWTRAQAAEWLDVTPSRVSQIAKSMGIKLRWSEEKGFVFSRRDVGKMENRSRKPGPKGNGR